MDSLPFSTYTNVVQYPKSKYLPKIIESIGDHIRAWRLENKLTQFEIATKLSVSEATVSNWEMNRVSPLVNQIPGIIELLGYSPIKVDATTLGGRISMYRHKHGLTPKEFGLLMSANASTVRAWENGEHTPQKKRIKSIEKVLRGGKLMLKEV